MLTTSSALTWPARDAAATSEVVRSASQSEWKLTRRCSATPGQLMSGLGLVGLLSLVIGLCFWSFGARPVLVFSGIEIAALTLALWFHTRHAGDGDTIVLSGAVLAIESRHGSTLTRRNLGAFGLRVQSPKDDRSLVRIEGHGVMVEVGGYVPPARRLAFARELRQAVRAGHCPLPGGAQIWS